MRLQILQHAPFEGPGHLTEWAASRSFSLEVVHTYKGIEPAKPDEYDWLVILGGPMSANDDKGWIRAEKRAIAEALNAAAAGKVHVIGICLGARLIAQAMGATITASEEKEIGWFDVDFTEDARNSHFFADFPQRSTVFHWHGETFNLPDSCTNIASTAVTESQGFFHGSHIFGFQFHLEMLSNGVKNLMKHCKKDLKGHEKAPYIQSPKEIEAGLSKHLAENRRLLDLFLDELVDRT